MNQVNFSLKTKTKEQKAQALKIISNLENLFGEESVKVNKNWDYWVEVDVKETMGYVHELLGVYQLHIFRTGATIEGSGENMRYNQIDIPLTDIETIYLLG